MESIARAFEVEIKDLFEFIHLQAGWVKAEEIENCWMERMRNKND